MTALAHAGGLPLEELIPLVGGGGAALVFARAWVSVRLRRRRT